MQFAYYFPGTSQSTPGNLMHKSISDILIVQKVLVSLFLQCLCFMFFLFHFNSRNILEYSTFNHYSIIFNKWLIS